MAGQKDIRTSTWQDAHTSHLPCLSCCCLVAPHLTTVLCHVAGGPTGVGTQLSPGGPACLFCCSHSSASPAAEGNFLSALNFPGSCCSKGPRGWIMAV